MRILFLADIESKYYWDYYDKNKFKDIDLIVSCGDLEPDYLTFLATLTNLPVLYVHGNHDERYTEDNMGGCTCIDDKLFVYQGVRFLGLGGSMRYKPSQYQYTESMMKKRVKRLWPKIFFHRGFDILVTHAPARHINDDDDLPHQGFWVFRHLIERYHPKLFVHGHVHATYGGNYKRKDEYKGTTVINAYERYIVDYPTEKETSVL